MTSKRKTRYAVVMAAFVAVSAFALYFLLGYHSSAGLYRVTVLPSLGGAQTGVGAINEHGQVVGIGLAKDGYLHAFLWDREQGTQDLGVAEGRFDLNDAGQVAGAAADPNGDPHAFFWEPGKDRIPLRTLGGRSSQAMGINNRGQIVGVSETSSGIRHAFLWDAAQGMRDLGTLGGTESQARAINDAGVVFGLADTPTLEYQPFVWDPNDGMTATGLLPDACPLNGINRGSWVIGATGFPIRGGHIALWRRGKGAQELFPLEYLVPEPPLLNDANQVVFCELKERPMPPILRRLFPPRYRHSLWDPNLGRVPLDAYIPARAGESFHAMDINNQGWIVGILSNPKGDRARAVVLEPIPERWARRKKSHGGGEER